VRVAVPAAPVDRDAGFPPVLGELLPAVGARRALRRAFGRFLRGTAPRLFVAAGEGGVPAGLPIVSQRFCRPSRPSARTRARPSRAGEAIPIVATTPVWRPKVALNISL